MTAALLPGPAESALFASAVLVLNATPGADFLLTVSRTLQGGSRAGAAAALGIATGCVVHAVAAALGLAALLALHPQGLRAVQWAGAAYLCWIGAVLLRRASCAAQTAAGPADPAVDARPLGADFRAGLLTNVLNPKVALFILAFLPQFVPAASPSKTLSLLLLGAWFVAQGTVFLLALVGVAARLRRLAVSQPARRVGNAVAGLLFFALALRLLRGQPAAA